MLPAPGASPMLGLSEPLEDAVLAPPSGTMTQELQMQDLPVHSKRDQGLQKVVHATR